MAWLPSLHFGALPTTPSPTSTTQKGLGPAIPKLSSNNQSQCNALPMSTFPMALPPSMLSIPFLPPTLPAFTGQWPSANLFATNSLLPLRTGLAMPLYAGGGWPLLSPLDVAIHMASHPTTSTSISSPSPSSSKPPNNAMSTSTTASIPPSSQGSTGSGTSVPLSRPLQQGLGMSLSADGSWSSPLRPDIAIPTANHPIPVNSSTPVSPANTFRSTTTGIPSSGQGPTGRGTVPVSQQQGLGMPLLTGGSWPLLSQLDPAMNMTNFLASTSMSTAPGNTNIAGATTSATAMRKPSITTSAATGMVSLTQGQVIRGTDLLSQPLQQRLGMPLFMGGNWPLLSQFNPVTHVTTRTAPAGTRTPTVSRSASATTSGTAGMPSSSQGALGRGNVPLSHHPQQGLGMPLFAGNTWPLGSQFNPPTHVTPRITPSATITGHISTTANTMAGMPSSVGYSLVNGPSASTELCHMLANVPQLNIPFASMPTACGPNPQSTTTILPSAFDGPQPMEMEEGAIEVLPTGHPTDDASSLSSLSPLEMTSIHQPSVALCDVSHGPTSVASLPPGLPDTSTDPPNHSLSCNGVDEGYMTSTSTDTHRPCRTTQQQQQQQQQHQASDMDETGEACGIPAPETIDDLGPDMVLPSDAPPSDQVMVVPLNSEVPDCCVMDAEQSEQPDTPLAICHEISHDSLPFLERSFPCSPSSLSTTSFPPDSPSTSGINLPIPSSPCSFTVDVPMPSSPSSISTDQPPSPGPALFLTEEGVLPQESLNSDIGQSSSSSPPPMSSDSPSTSSNSSHCTSFLTVPSDLPPSTLKSLHSSGPSAGPLRRVVCRRMRYYGQPRITRARFAQMLLTDSTADAAERPKEEGKVPDRKPFGLIKLRKASVSLSDLGPTRKRPKVFAEQPNWLTHRFLVLRAMHELGVPSRRQAICKRALDLDAKIARKYRCQRSFGGLTPLRSASAVLTTHPEQLETTLDENGKRLYQLAFRFNDFEQARERYEAWKVQLWAEHWPKQWLWWNEQRRVMKPKTRWISPPKNEAQVVHVKSSNLMGAGRGIFASVDIPYDTTIGFYFGVPCFEDEYDRDKDHIGQSSEYSIRYKGTVLDATDPKGNPYDCPLLCPFHMLNDHPTLFNVALVDGPVVNQILVIATRDIEKGEELYADYGTQIDRQGWKYEMRH